jgi:hypothetical protein
LDDRQLDLFATAPPRGDAQPDPSAARQPFPALETQTDDAVIASLAEVGLRNCAALAAEAGRRKLAAAVPALTRLCRRFAGWGTAALVPEQVAALHALTQIGGRSAATAVADGIVRGEFIGATLGVAVAAAAALGAVLPEAVVLRLLRHDDPRLRADACRCVRPSPAMMEMLDELLGDLHPEVQVAAACALGMLGRAEARPILARLLQDEPTPEIVAAFAIVADHDGLVQLQRLARCVPALAEAVVDALDACDHPRAAAVSATLQVSG